MKRTLCMLIGLCFTLLTNAQATDLVIDCQTPGWLSSKINYGDQQTVRNLKVTGYVNAVDMQFIGTLIQKQKLDGCVDLSNVYVTDENKDNFFEVNTFAMNQNDSIKCLRLPRVLKGATNCLSRLHVDTLDCNWDLNYAKIDQFGKGSVDCIILGEKIDSIPAMAFNKSSKVKDIKVRGMLRYIGNQAFQSIPFKSFIFPQSLSYIGNSAFDGHNMHKVILPDSIDYIGSYAFRGDSLEFVKLPTKAKEIGVGAFEGYVPDTIFVPEGIERFTSMFVTFKRGQTWIFPETVKYIDGNLLTLTGHDGWDPTNCNIYLKSNSVVEVSVLMITSTTSIDDALESARRFRSGWTVHVPKGMIENYRNSQFWYRTHTGRSYGHDVYYAYCYWCHATFKEIENRVTGIRLDRDSVVLSKVGDSVGLTAFVMPEDADNKEVKWISTNNTVCMVSSDGLVVATGQGVATIMCITQDGGYSATCTVRVIQHVTDITLNKNTVSLKVGESELLKATVTPTSADDKSVIWSSSAEGIATVDASGNVKGLKAGEAWIKVVSQDNALAKDSCLVTVIQPVTGITLSKDNYTFDKIGETVQLEATVLPADASNKAVNWSSTNNQVCTVSNGLVAAIGAGTASVTVSTLDGNFSASCFIKVVQHVATVELNKTATSLKVGESERLATTVSPDDAEDKALVWSSTNEQIASVDANGNVKGLKAGEAWVKAVSQDNEQAKDSCLVTVIQPVTGITLSQSSYQLTNIGESFQLEATVQPEDASNKEVRWSSSNESVCIVANGKVVATGFGTAVVMAVTNDGGFMATCAIVVEKETIPVTGITLSQTEAELREGETMQLTATVEPNDATNKALIWKSSDESICVITQSGVLIALAEGKAIVTVVPEYGVGQAQCSVTVNSKESTAIEDVVCDGGSSVPVFDMMGRRVYSLIKGRLYIRNGQKFIAQ